MSDTQFKAIQNELKEIKNLLSIIVKKDTKKATNKIDEEEPKGVSINIDLSGSDQSNEEKVVR